LVATFKALVAEFPVSLSQPPLPLAPEELLVALAANLALLFWAAVLRSRLLVGSPPLQGRWKAALVCRGVQHTWPLGLPLTLFRVLSTTLEWSFQAPLAQLLKT
jgi:hypothetical protein